MARPIVLSNGELHVGINTYGLVHDVYYPYVGLENHTIGRDTRHRVGVWVDGELSWLDDGNWQFQFKYHDSALIGSTSATHDGLGIVLEFDDAVDADTSVFMRNIHVVNKRETAREIRLFMHQAFVIGDSRSNTDTVQYLPDSQAILHYRGRRAFIISGKYESRAFDQYSVGLFGIEGREGTWRDAEDGELSMSNVEHGRVDSTLRFTLQIDALSSGRVQYWIAAGTTLREALAHHGVVRHDGIARRLEATASSWQRWLEPAQKLAEQLPRDERRFFLTSLMMLKAHMDKRGAIIASTDSGMLNYGRDAYAYCWPRDGAHILWPLIRLGYEKEPLAFFDFCRRGLHPGGYFSHKYRADGAIGSSWHTYLHDDGSVSPPIQIDETAGVLFMFAEFYDAHPNESLLREYYESFVVPMAEFLTESIDPQTHLPEPSYDLWEENHMTTTYTTAVTYGALAASAHLAEVMHDEAHAVAWRAASDDIKQYAADQLYDQERGTLIKGLRRSGDGYEVDTTIDSSAIFGAFIYGLVDGGDQRMTNSVETWLRRFNQTEYTALPRYENDAYRREDGNRENYWHITTLWYAQYALETGDTHTAERLLEWVRDHSYDSGVLAEQIVPGSEHSTSVAPLAWSHAEYATTVLDALSHRETEE